jgi:hypothetical protein
MRRTLYLTVALLGIVAIVGSFAVGTSAYLSLRREASNLRAERRLLVARLDATESMIDQTTVNASITNRVAELAESTPNLTDTRAVVMTNSVGRKTYVFAKLYGADNQVIAREAQFREILGFTKLAFNTSEGPRLYDVDDLHAEVIRSLGYDAGVLKRTLSEAVRRRELLAQQQQFQAELRHKAAMEAVEREKAASERTKAEAALREAKARERLADAAERAAVNPPRQQAIHKFVIVPGSKVITNSPTTPLTQSQ